MTTLTTTTTARGLVLLASLSSLASLASLVACRREEPPASDRPAAEPKGAEVEAVPGETKAEPEETPPPFDPAKPGVPIDDANRFVLEDLTRFMADFPQVLREQDVPRMRDCWASACLPEGVHESVTPFGGAGIRYLVPLWLRGCLTGSAESCLRAGRTYQWSALAYDDDEPPTHTGWSRYSLDERFRRYIARACDLSEVHCEQWADFLLADPSPTPQDVTRAIERLKAGCDRDEHGSCAALARHADRYPAIGEARQWWRRACEHDPRLPSDECATYAELLLATGKAEDRAAAAVAMGPMCDPSSPAWKSQCPGDAADASEECDVVYFQLYALPCVELAGGRPPDDALRLYAAFCVGTAGADAPKVNAAGRRACSEATRLADRLGRSTAYREALHRRTCMMAESECLDVTTFDLDACGAARERCLAAP